MNKNIPSETSHSVVRRLCTLIASSALIIASSSVSYADVGWIGGDGDWGTATNWNPNQVPTSSDTIFLNTSSPTQPQINGARTVGAIDFDDTNGINWAMNSGATSSSLTVEGAITHTATKSLNFYALSTGSLDLSANSLTLSGSGGGTILGGGSGGSVTNTLGTLTLGSLTASNGNLIRILASSASLGDVSLTNASTLNIYNNSGSGTGGATVTSLTGSSDSVLAASALTSTSTATLTIDSSTDSTYAGTLTNNSNGTGATLAVVKTGSGTQSLSHANYYTGGTTISGGTILLSNTAGSGIGTGAVVVESGGALGGTGIVRLNTTESTTVNNGGVITPGGDGIIGTFAFSGENSSGDSLIMESGARFAFDLGAGDTSDTLALWFYQSGDLVLNNTAIDFSGAQEGDYTLFTFYSDNGVNITTSNISSGIDLLNSTGLDGYDAQLNYGTSSITLSVTAIPELSTNAMIAGFVALLFVAMRRMRQRRDS